MAVRSDAIVVLPGGYGNFEEMFELVTWRQLELDGKPVGLAETSRLGLALGAAAQTFMGLTGAGDLNLTCTGELSRNRQVGLMLGRGTRLPEALERLGHVAEGVWSAPAVQQRAAALGVRMPIPEAVCAVLDGRTSPRRALEGLLARQPGREGPE